MLPEDLLGQTLSYIMSERSKLTKELNTAFDTTMKNNIDYIITLGGDGTILWAAKQFNTGPVPPMITFAQGSLGFMCNFTFEDHEKILMPIFKSVRNKLRPEEIGLENRLRLKVNAGPDTPSTREIFRGDQLQNSEPFELVDVHCVNEIVVDRGPSPYTVQLNIYVDGNRMTCAVGDGIVVATPTGSTAYSMSAGGSIVATQTHCICLTPLAPHSLSFRPIILPASSTIRIEKEKDGRNSAWVSLDGANRFKLEEG